MRIGRCLAATNAPAPHCTGGPNVNPTNPLDDCCNIFPNISCSTPGSAKSHAVQRPLRLPRRINLRFASLRLRTQGGVLLLPARSELRAVQHAQCSGKPLWSMQTESIGIARSAKHCATVLRSATQYAVPMRGWAHAHGLSVPEAKWTGLLLHQSGAERKIPHAGSQATRRNGEPAQSMQSHLCF